MSNYSHHIGIGALLAVVLVAPPTLEADPVSTCGPDDMAALTADERADTLGAYRDTVASSYKREREQTELRIAQLTEQGLCETFLWHYTNIVCRAQNAQLDNMDQVIDKRAEDCGRIFNHLSTPANWEKFASCRDEQDSTRDFRELQLDCTGDSICGEVHGLMAQAMSTASTPSQAFAGAPECLKNLYQDVYTDGDSATAGEAKEIVEIFTTTTTF